MIHSSLPVALGGKGDFQWHRKGVALWPAGAASCLAAVAEVWEQKGSRARLIVLRSPVPGGMLFPR